MMDVKIVEPRDASSRIQKERKPRPTGSAPVRCAKSVGRLLLRGERYYQAKQLLREVTCHSTGAIRCRPDFLVIGAQKSGSSSLFFYLQQHPQFMLPLNVTKEVHYFDQHYGRGFNWYRGHFPIGKLRDLASKVSGRRIVTGEATPEYLVHPLAPERAASDLPNAQFIAVLRNPIERAWSHYKMEVKRTAERRTFEDAILPELQNGPLDLVASSDEELAEWNCGLNVAYLTRGMYAEQIERWLAATSRDQVMVILAEEIFTDTARTYARISKFLGIDAVIPGDLRNLNSGGYREEMKPSTRKRLQEFFASHNDRTSEVLGRRLDWA